MKVIITIDGASGSGKTTLSQRLAAALGGQLLPSGTLYRIVAYWDNLGIAVAEMPLLSLHKDITIDQHNDAIYYLDEDITERLYQPLITEKASIIAQNSDIRARLLSVQKHWPFEHILIAEGRDMGSVVFPDAMIKIFVTCSLKTRASRRFEQLLASGIHAKLDDVEAEIAQRDTRDQQRVHAPLIVPEGAVMWDNDARTIDEQVDNMVLFCNNHILGRP